MKIGSVTLENQTILAPLAGITNLPFRLLAKEAGCALVCTEMISAHGLVNKSNKTEKLMDSLPAEKPLSVQIFGSDPEVVRLEKSSKMAPERPL
jgi:tRNA-dihydrouridine synthase